MSGAVLHDGIFDWEDLEATEHEAGCVKSALSHHVRRMASMWGMRINGEFTELD